MRSEPIVEQSTAGRRLASPLRDFIATQNASAVVLLAAAIMALRGK